MSKAARAVQVPGAPNQAAAPLASTETGQASGADTGGANPGDLPGSEVESNGPSEAEILREQLAALQAQNAALVAQIAQSPAVAEAPAPAPVVAAAPAAPAAAGGLHPSQKAVQTEKGWIVPPTYGSPVNRPR